MKKKRLKLKKQVWFVIVLIIFGTIGIIAFNKIHAKYELENTTEYKLKEIGYTEEEITTLKKYYDEDNLKKFISQKKDETLLEFMNSEHYIHDNYERPSFAVDLNLNLIKCQLDTGFFYVKFLHFLSCVIVCIVVECT